MFPIPFNFPFINKNGSRTTIGDAINAGGGGSQYELPTASSVTKGGVKIGSGLTMTGEVLSNTNPTPYSLPTASTDTLGGVIVGSGLSITDGVLSATGGGGGGSAGHCYHVQTQDNTYSELLVFTTVKSIASFNDLYNAIKNYGGYCIVTYSNALTGNKVGQLIEASGVNLRGYALKYTMDNGALTMSYETTTISSLTFRNVHKLY